MSALQCLFGPSKKAIWQQLSGEIDGRYIPAGFWTGDKVQARHGEWTVTLDSYVVMAHKTPISYTRMRAPFVNPGGFRFAIGRANVFSGIAAWLGAEDIEIGLPPFDGDFVIKGTHPARVRALFANPRLRELVAAQPDIQLAVKDDEGWFGAEFPDGVDELHFAVTGIIKDVDRLKLLFELFAETLDQLVAMGDAYPRDPRVAL